MLSRAPEGMTFEKIEANGLPALLVRVKGQIVSVLTLDVEGEFIRAVRNVANPDKLAHLNLPPTSDQEWRINRDNRARCRGNLVSSLLPLRPSSLRTSDRSSKERQIGSWILSSPSFK